MRRVNIPKYKARWGNAKAEAIVAASESIEGVYATISNDVWRSITDPEKTIPDIKPTKRDKSLLRKALHAAKSVTQTQILQQHRVTDEEFDRRLSVCKSCDHAVMSQGEPRTCGKMIDALRDKNLPTCGCILNLKARDKREDCPQNKW